MLKKHISADYSIFCIITTNYLEIYVPVPLTLVVLKSLKVDSSIRIGAIFYLLMPFIRAIVLQKRKNVCVWTNLTEVKIAFSASRKLYHFPWTYVHSKHAPKCKGFLVYRLPTPAKNYDIRAKKPFYFIDFERAFFRFFCQLFSSIDNLNQGIVEIISPPTCLFRNQ